MGVITPGVRKMHPIYVYIYIYDLVKHISRANYVNSNLDRRMLIQGGVKRLGNFALNRPLLITLLQIPPSTSLMRPLGSTSCGPD